ncbi:bifunctional metallophosphatase/5'-nucleotidase [Gorillibacterium massiliense]|uniref:bifunctional metallophosphatase/5'-nucleotidase n=1 Tax=Gorillibacterium massiliense TaxID=1280390 RepID=UPI000594A396|nr:bifunctional UDP-sugar hydrolase/5'-nucleotidase [Gorillibacterium massiliense]
MSDRLKKVFILHTNDIHSHFEEMPQIAGMLNRLRAERKGADIVTVDIGDHIDRANAISEGTMGAANVAIMNAAGYDFAVPGNNEGLTLLPSELADAYSGGKFRALCANLSLTDTGAPPPWLKPYAIVEKGGLRIGFIGVTAAFTQFYRLIGWEATDPFEAVACTIHELLPHTDVRVVLSHLGIQNDRKLAESIPGIDVIIGGHTHHLLEKPEQIGNTYLFAAGKFGKYVGVVELSYETGTRQLAGVDGTCYPCLDAAPDPGTETIIRQQKRLSDDVLHAPVCRLDHALPVDWQSESALGNLLAAGLKRHTGAEIGLVNSGQILESLLPGVVTKEALHRMCPSPINPCLTLLSGEDIRQALEESLLPEFYLKRITGYGFRGYMLGGLSVDGMQVQFDPEGKPYQKILHLAVNGEPLEPDRLYRVGTIDMFTFIIGYTTLARGSATQFFLPEFIRDLMATELQKDSSVRNSLRLDRWQQINRERSIT